MLNKSRFLMKLHLSPTHASPRLTVEKVDGDLRSYCGNSDLFNTPSTPPSERHLPEHELRHQASFFKV